MYLRCCEFRTTRCVRMQRNGIPDGWAFGKIDEWYWKKKRKKKKRLCNTRVDEKKLRGWPRFSASCSRIYLKARSLEKKKNILFFEKSGDFLYIYVASSTREIGNIKSMGTLILYNEECPLIFSQQLKIFVRNFLTRFDQILAKYSIKNSKLFFSRTLDSCCFTPRRTYRISTSNPLSHPYTNPLPFIEIDIEKLRIILSSLNTAVHNCERKWRFACIYSAAIQGVEVGNESWLPVSEWTREFEFGLQVKLISIN